ncbi:MAG: hypothetical protein PHR26_02200 [Candidatus ainarchaeum sp.]|nr:hypothetical protein [Candidatus ainarchaeum sp.]MDD3976200.1 hypothetical protein [Candidatus ainarchaeum sp.]
MFEFALSKLNMLLFATAIAAIILFFMNTVNSNLQTRQSYELAYNIGRDIKLITDSESYCSIKYIDIPTRIKSGQSSTTTFNKAYVLNIMELEKENPENNYNKKLVISILNQKQDKIYGAYDIDFNGDFTFYNAEHPYDNSSNWSSKQDYGIYDTLRVKSNDSTLILIKNKIEGQDNYYILPCAKQNGILTCKKIVCDDSMFEDVSCKSVDICINEYNEPNNG